MKSTLYITFFSFLILSCSNKSQLNFECEKLIRVDSLEFVKNKIPSEKFDKISELKKVNGEIKIPNQNKLFKDNLSEDKFIEHTVTGKYKDLNLIMGQGLNQNIYFLVNNGKIDTLVGNPQIFENRILSIEDSYTDFPEIIEIWEIKENGKLKFDKSFSIKYCKDSAIKESYINKNILYICTGYEWGKNQFYKVILK
jgi:hypothetical protein